MSEYRSHAARRKARKARKPKIKAKWHRSLPEDFNKHPDVIAIIVHVDGIHQPHLGTWRTDVTGQEVVFRTRRRETSTRFIVRWIDTDEFKDFMYKDLPKDDDFYYGAHAYDAYRESNRKSVKLSWGELPADVQRRWSRLEKRLHRMAVADAHSWET